MSASINLDITPEDLESIVADCWHDSAIETAKRVVKAFAYPRYLAGNWSHLFPERGRDVERNCRIVFDRVENKVIAMDVTRDNKWRASTQVERDDLTDSIVNANPDAIEKPEDWDLLPVPVLPGWAR